MSHDFRYFPYFLSAFHPLKPGNFVSYFHKNSRAADSKGNSFHKNRIGFLIHNKAKASVNIKVHMWGRDFGSRVFGWV